MKRWEHSQLNSIGVYCIDKLLLVDNSWMGIRFQVSNVSFMYNLQYALKQMSWKENTPSLSLEDKENINQHIIYKLGG